MQNQVEEIEKIALKELIIKLTDWWFYLLSKWKVILIFSVIGASIGICYAWLKRPIYKATVTFALEDDKQTAGGLSGALGLASSLGFDLGGSAGGAFSGANLIELMKSRKIVEKALLNPILHINDSITLADRLLEILNMKKVMIDEKIWDNHSFFSLGAERSSFSYKQDSILGILYRGITGENGILSVTQKDKKISIIYVEVHTDDELFSKVFAESVVKEVSQFYIETKSKKARINVAILQKQADSVRNELNLAITGVAVVSDNTFNLNPALNINRVPSTKRQVDIQANTAILTQLVTNLELAKVTLLKETPLIQVIDKPILPLKKEKPRKLTSLIVGGFVAAFFGIFFLVLKRLFNQVMS